MKEPSKRRQAALVDDKEIVSTLYREACEKWGETTVRRDISHIWDLRCMWGISRRVPFGSMVSQNMGEVLWVAVALCGVQPIYRTGEGER